MTFPFPFLMPMGKAPLSYTYNGNFSATAAATTTIAGVDFGAASADRIVVITMGSVGSPARTVASATIGGVTAGVANSTGTNVSTHMIWAVVPIGLNGTVSITFSGATLRTVRITSYSIYGAASAEPSVVGSISGGGGASRTTSETTTEPAVIIASSAGDQNASSAVWSGSVAQDYKYVDGNDSFSSASFQQTLPGGYTATYSHCRAIMSLGWS